MKIIAVDDERIALEGLISSIQKVVQEADVQGFRSPDEALIYAKEHPVEVAFLDIEMRKMDGITLAKKLKAVCHNVNIIFTTGYGEYRENAFELHASGYVTKPVTPEKIKAELEELRHPVERIPKGTPENQLRLKTFGNFEAYVGTKPLVFKYKKSKELLAYLVDRNGSFCSNSEIMAALWEEDETQKNHISYLKNTRTDLAEVLQAAGCLDALERQRAALRIVPEKVSCDYYDYLDKKLSGINAYFGEYMTQYSWAETTHGTLEECK